MKESIYFLDKSNIHMFRLLFPEDLEKSFGDDRIGFGVMCDDTPAALLLATFTEDAFWVDWLYVKEEYRLLGISYRLLNTFYKNISGITYEDMVFANGIRIIQNQNNNNLRLFSLYNNRQNQIGKYRG